MKFDEIWKQLTKKQPKLERDDAVVEFKAGKLRQLLKQVYDQGAASVPREAKAKHDPLARFRDIFEGRRHG